MLNVPKPLLQKRPTQIQEVYYETRSVKMFKLSCQFAAARCRNLADEKRTLCSVLCVYQRSELTIIDWSLSTCIHVKEMESNMARVCKKYYFLPRSYKT
jgi:hypothetical protein